MLAEITELMEAVKSTLALNTVVESVPYSKPKSIQLQSSGKIFQAF
jgi:hypothetical protein